MGFWESRRVVLSGGNGFLGSFVVEKLRASGCREISTPHSREYDLRENLRRCGYTRMRGGHFHSPCSGGGRNRREPNKPWKIFLRQRRDGHQRH